MPDAYAVKALEKSAETKDQFRQFSVRGDRIYCNGNQYYEDAELVLVHGHGKMLFCAPFRRLDAEIIKLVPDQVCPFYQWRSESFNG